jgi:hypothetical protein
MAEPQRKEDYKQDERNEAFEEFQDLAKKLMAVPKEELDEKREQEKNEKRAG